MCSKCEINFSRRKPIEKYRQWWIFKWKQYFCWNCGTQLIYTTGSTTLGVAYWRLNMLAFLYKWLWCSWVHKKYRCRFGVGNRNLDYLWHCTKCHPCDEELDNWLQYWGEE